MKCKILPPTRSRRSGIRQFASKYLSTSVANLREYACLYAKSAVRHLSDYAVRGVLYIQRIDINQPTNEVRRDKSGLYPPYILHSYINRKYTWLRGEGYLAFDRAFSELAGPTYPLFGSRFPLPLGLGLWSSTRCIGLDLSVGDCLLLA